MLPIDPRILLRPLMPPDYEAARAIEAGPELIDRGRLHGRCPSPGEYIHLLWAPSLLQTAVCEARTGELLGFVTVYDANLRHQTACIAMVSRGEAQHRGLVMAGLLAQIHELFTEWPFRKLYAEVLDDNRSQFARGLAKLGELEGTLVADQRTRWGFADRHIYALHKERWFETMGPVVRRRQALANGQARRRFTVEIDGAKAG